MHSWRDNLKPYYLRWQALDIAHANKFGRRLPPKCNAGRWGSISYCEERVLSGLPHLRVVVSDVLRKRNWDVEEPKPLDDADPTAAAPSKIHDPREDDMQAHVHKMGIWRRDTVEVAESDLWWKVVEIVERSHRPLQHCLHFIQKAVPEHELEKGSRLAHLVCGGARRIFHSFGDLLEDRGWFRGLAECAGTLGATRSQILELTVLMILHYAAGHHRRVVQPCEQFWGYALISVVRFPVCFGLIGTGCNHGACPDTHKHTNTHKHIHEQFGCCCPAALLLVAEYPRTSGRIQNARCSGIDSCYTLLNGIAVCMWVAPGLGP